MVVNKDWHIQNRMAKNASFEDRVKWHQEHVKNCTCAPFPKKLQAEMKEKNIE